MSTFPKPAAGVLAAGVATGAVASVVRAFAEHTANGQTWDADEKAAPIYAVALVLALLSTTCITLGIYRLVRHADDAALRAAYFAGEGAEKAAKFRAFLDGGDTARPTRNPGSTPGSAPPTGTADR